MGWGEAGSSKFAVRRTLPSRTQMMAFDDPLLVITGEPGESTLMEFCNASMARYAGLAGDFTIFKRATPGATVVCDETACLVDPVANR